MDKLSVVFTRIIHTDVKSHINTKVEQKNYWRTVIIQNFAINSITSCTNHQRVSTKTSDHTGHIPFVIVTNNPSQLNLTIACCIAAMAKGGAVRTTKEKMVHITRSTSNTD